MSADSKQAQNRGRYFKSPIRFVPLKRGKDGPMSSPPNRGHEYRRRRRKAQRVARRITRRAGR